MEHLTSKNFKEIIENSDKPVLVDFWASWCGPCQMLGPIIEELDAKLTDVLVAKVDVDEEQSLAMEYKVASIPTLLLFKNGQPAERMVGFHDKDEILEMLK